MHLTPEQLETYHQNGYIIIPCPFSGGLTQACLNAVEKVDDDPVPKEDGKKNHHRLRPQMPDSYWCALDHSLPFLNIELHPEIIELARQLENDPDIYFRNGGINELAPNRSFLWHRDSELDYVEYMHYFSGATKKNGCLRVIPGSHVGSADPLKAHVEALRRQQGVPENPSTDGYADVELPGKIALEVEPDHLIVRSSRIFHATHLNASPQSRLMHHWLFRDHTASNHRFTFEDYLTPKLIDQLTEEQREVLWLHRDFDLDPKYEKERERELGNVQWSVV